MILEWLDDSGQVVGTTELDAVTAEGLQLPISVTEHVIPKDARRVADYISRGPRQVSIQGLIVPRSIGGQAKRLEAVQASIEAWVSDGRPIRVTTHLGTITGLVTSLAFSRSDTEALEVSLTIREYQTGQIEWLAVPRKKRRRRARKLYVGVKRGCALPGWG